MYSFPGLDEAFLYYSNNYNYYNKITNYYSNNSRNSGLRQRFSRPPGERRLRGATGARFVLMGLKRPNRSAPQVILKIPRGHENSEYALSFEIGQRESGFYSEQTDRIAETSSTVLVYSRSLAHYNSLLAYNSLFPLEIFIY